MIYIEEKTVTPMASSIFAKQIPKQMVLSLSKNIRKKEKGKTCRVETRFILMDHQVLKGTKGSTSDDDRA